VVAVSGSLLSAKGVSPELMSQVAYKEGMKGNYFHLNPIVELPKMENGSKGLVVENQCRVCHKDEFFNDTKIGYPDAQIPTVITRLEFHYKTCSDY
jgi:hypothetical protein